jgi:predicted GNAT family acetyltransferase
MQIQHEHLVSRGEFFLRDEQLRKIAVLTYTMSGNDMVIEHTIVEEALEGQGIGRKLVDAAVLYAREKGYKIIPQCPYAAAVIKKTPEYQDILAS